MRRFRHAKEAGILLALIVLVALIGVLEPAFLTQTNLYLLSRQIALTAIVSFGVLFVILTAGIDLSLGSVVGLTGFACGLAMAAGLHPVLAVGVGLATGALVGAVNGVIVAFLGVTPFIVTLGMLGVARGLIYIIRHGDSVRGIAPGFVAFGTGQFLGVPVPVLICVLIAILAHAALQHTAFGRQVYAVGGNEEGARLSGINPRRVKLLTYVVSSMLCAVTGILFVARFNSAQADAGRGMELDAIAAAVIGGTSLMGGVGSVIGVLIGATIMGVVRNGLVLLQVSSYWQELIIGAIIVLAAILDAVRSKRR